VFLAAIILLFFLFTYGDVLRSVDTDENVLFLTFDDGPGPYTAEVLDILLQHNVTATFFLVGERVEENPDLVLRMLNESHVVGSHSYSHKWLIFNITGEVTAGHDALFSVVNESVKFFRAPYGFLLPGTLKAANDLNLQVVRWSCFPRDYSATRQEIVSRVSRCLKLGEIITLHPWNNVQTVQALPDIIALAQEEGFRFDVLS